MNVVIVEDDFIVADHLKLMLEKHQVQVIEIADSYERALTLMDLQPDLFFVDIRLSGEKTGIDLAIELNKNNISFIYLTANNEMPMLQKAAETTPLSYITKPYKESDIVALLEIYKSRKEKKLTVKTAYGKKSIPVSSILFIESEGVNAKIVTSENEYVERINLSDFEIEFSSDFVRVHRGYIVNRKKIDQFNSKQLFIKDHIIPISRSYRDLIKKLYH